VQHSDERQEGIEMNVEAVGPLHVAAGRLVGEEQPVGDRPVEGGHGQAGGHAVHEHHPEHELGEGPRGQPHDEAEGERAEEQHACEQRQEGGVVARKLVLGLCAKGGIVFSQGKFNILFLPSINQIDECHISQDQSQKLNYLRDSLPEDRCIHLFNKNTYNYFKVNKQNKI